MKQSNRIFKQIWNGLSGIGIIAFVYFVFQSVLQIEIQNFWNFNLKPLLNYNVKFSATVWELLFAFALLVGVVFIGSYVTSNWLKTDGTRNHIPSLHILKALTENERRILMLRVEGKSLDEIGQALDIKRINQAIRKICEKIHVHDESQAILWYYKNAIDVKRDERRNNAEKRELVLPADTHKVTFTWSYTVLYVTLMMFIYLPKFLLSQQATQDFWDSYAGIYFLLPLSSGIFCLYHLFRFRKVLQQNSEFRILNSKRDNLVYRSYQYLVNLPPLLFLASGLIFWSIGQAIYMAYNLMHIRLPYPSLADYGYSPYGLLWVIGVLLLRRHIEFRQSRIHWLVFILIFILLYLHVGILIFISRDGHFDLPKDPWKAFFDFYYPLVSVLNFSILAGIVCCLSVIEDEIAKFRIPLQLIFIGVIFWYVADSGFSTTTSLPEGHYWAFNSGNWVDFSFMSAFWLVGVGMSWLPILITTQDLADENGTAHSDADSQIR